MIVLLIFCSKMEEDIMAIASKHAYSVTSKLYNREINDIKCSLECDNHLSIIVVILYI